MAVLGQAAESVMIAPSSSAMNVSAIQAIPNSAIMAIIPD